jgi:hypothetical protein
MYSIYKSRSYTCGVTSLGNVMIQPTMYFALRHVPLFYGPYWIMEVSHNVTETDFTTKFKGIRMQRYSLTKIDNLVASVNKNVLKTNDSLLKSYERSNVIIYYINNKDTIINYITKIYKMKLEMFELNNKLSSILSIFIKDNNINQYTLTKLVTAYNEYKMKLDKTLEEIKLHNKSLTDNKFKVTREYFELRLRNDEQLSNLKILHNKQKTELNYNIKMLRTISKQKIDFNVSLYKDNVKNRNDIKIISDKVYNDLIMSFERSNNIYYVNNKEAIMNYIITLYTIKVEMDELNKSLNENICDFKKQNNIKSAQSAYLISQYKELKTNLDIYSKCCHNINDLKSYLAEKEELSSIVEEIFLNEVKNII